jgi:hypothetical protein
MSCCRCVNEWVIHWIPNTNTICSGLISWFGKNSVPVNWQSFQFPTNHDMFTLMRVCCTSCHGFQICYRYPADCTPSIMHMAKPTRPKRKPEFNAWLWRIFWQTFPCDTDAGKVVVWTLTPWGVSASRMSLRHGRPEFDTWLQRIIHLANLPMHDSGRWPNYGEALVVHGWALFVQKVEWCIVPPSCKAWLS